MKKSTKIFIDMALEIRKFELENSLRKEGLSDFDREIRENALKTTIQVQEEFQKEMWPNRIFPKGDEEYE